MTTLPTPSEPRKTREEKGQRGVKDTLKIPRRREKRIVKNAMKEIRIRF